MKYLEQREQGAFIDWAKTQRMPSPFQKHKLSDYLFAIPNGEHRKPSIAAKLKWQGVKAGVSDLFLPFPRHGYRGLWCEMKKSAKAYDTDNERRSALLPHQRDWLNLMRGQGYAGITTWGLDEARDLFLAYLGKSGDKFIAAYKAQVARE
jgi:hypothetical protein